MLQWLLYGPTEKFLLLTSEADAQNQSERRHEARGDQQLQAVGEQPRLPAFLQVILC